MYYVATLTFDYTGNHDHNWRSRILTALEGLGWDYVPTSSMVLDGAPDIGPVVRALEVLARAVDAPGDLSMMALQVKLVGDARPAPGGTTPDNALRTIRQIPPPQI